MKSFSGPLLIFFLPILLLLSGCGDGNGGANGLYGGWQESGQSDLRFKLHKATLTPRPDFVILTLDLTVENQTADNFDAVPPSVSAMSVSSDGQTRNLGLYFQAFQPKPVVPAGQTQRVEVQFMLPPADLDGEIRLQFGSSSRMIKTQGGGQFLSSLPQDEPKEFTSPSWEK